MYTNQWDALPFIGELERVKGFNCLRTAPTHISLFVLSIGYVLVCHCQQARYVHQFVHQYGWAWPTPLPHVYIHGQLHRSVTDSVNHIQLPLMALTWVTEILINVFRQSRCQTRVKVFVFFYNGDDRNDKEIEKYVRAIARGLWVSHGEIIQAVNIIWINIK